MGLIQIPQEILDKQKKSAATARVMDTKQLARQLLMNSYAGGHVDCRISAGIAFRVAKEFMDEQARLFPNHETADGTEKDATHV